MSSNSQYRSDPPFATEENHREHPDDVRTEGRFGEVEEDGAGPGPRPTLSLSPHRGLTRPRVPHITIGTLPPPPPPPTGESRSSVISQGTSISSPIAPRVQSISRRMCKTCHELSTFMSSKHRICYDCLVHSLVQAKLFYQGFDVSRKTEEKMCIVCLDHCRYVGDKYRVCIDCLINRLGELGVIKFEEATFLDPLYLALNTDSNRDFECIDWQRKKYYDCDVCERTEIEGHRRERLCLDCLFDLLIDTNHFVKRNKRTYRRS